MVGFFQWILKVCFARCFWGWCYFKICWVCWVIVCAQGNFGYWLLSLVYFYGTRVLTESHLYFAEYGNTYGNQHFLQSILSMSFKLINRWLTITSEWKVFESLKTEQMTKRNQKEKFLPSLFEWRWIYEKQLRSLMSARTGCLDSFF